MPATFHGSPTHVLIVHVVVVLLPLAVLGALVVALVPPARRGFALLTLAVAFIGCVAVPVAFLSGGKLRGLIPPSPLINRHVQLAHQLLPLAAAFGLCLAGWVGIDLVRRARLDRLNSLEQRLAGPALAEFAARHRLRGISRVVTVLLIVLAIATGYQTYRVGDAGAKAAWAGRLSTNPAAAPHR